MDSSEARLDVMESQRSTDASHDQRRQIPFLLNLINGGLRTLSSRGLSQSRGEGRPSSPSGETNSMPEFLTNLRLSEIFHLPSEYVQMDAAIYSSVCDGDKLCLGELKRQGTQMACLKSDQGDSILHLAATWGHLGLVKSIVSECPYLLLQPNFKNQVPLHMAAHGGHSAVVEALVGALTFVSTKLSEEERERLNIYVVKDKDGDTPLHLALKGYYMEIASSLVNANNEASLLANNKGISPLYLAIESGDASLVKAMLNTTGKGGLEERNSNLDSKLEGRRYLVHAALKSRNTDILDVILKEDSSLADERDEEGRTCLSFGAFVGYVAGVRNLLDRSPQGVYVCDDDGSFPIHMAAKMGDINIICVFISHCPDSKHLLNRRGENILHIAAKIGNYELVELLISDKATKHLIVGRDVEGNTPLHLATMIWCSYSVYLLSKDAKTLPLRNNSGLRAQDIAESELKPNYIYQERATLGYLLWYTYQSGSSEEPIKSLTKPSEHDDKNNDYVNTLLLIAALVATMTFAAGFTIPGGFNSSSPHLGRATLATNPTLSIFLLLDILAMQFSIATIATLIWAQLGDPALVQTSLDVALRLMYLALVFTPLAFLFGVVTAVGHVKWLLAIICIITYCFLCFMLLIISPHIFLQLSELSPEDDGGYLVMYLRGKAHLSRTARDKAK